MTGGLTRLREAIRMWWTQRKAPEPRKAQPIPLAREDEVRALEERLEGATMANDAAALQSIAVSQKAISMEEAQRMTLGRLMRKMDQGNHQ